MNDQAKNFGLPTVIQEPDFLTLLFERYVQHTELLSFSERTIRTQRSYLRLLAAFLVEKDVVEIQTVTTTTLMDFQRWLYYRPTWRGGVRVAASMNRTLSVVKSFFHFLKQEGYLARDPSEDLEFAREPQRLPRNILTPQEARKIIEAPDTSTHLGYRDRTILEVLYATGIRKLELMNLTPEDVNLEEELLRINGGKGAKDRVAPLSRVACSFLESYIKGVRPELLREKQSSHLFVSLRGQAISKNALGEIVEKYARRAGVKKHVTCHLWRHSCATHLLKNNANLRHVQEILGHRSLATTERYLSLTITDLKEAHRKCHPREKGIASRE
ncbi:MAG: tyrosine-type recombinase/integrase [Verrucomicrobiae bacterium]|nr:tyrosine-type recombinase/integrase [Verrucomicrobiae bacterium]